MKFHPVLFIVLLGIIHPAFSDTPATSTKEVHQALLNDFKPQKVAEHTYVIHGPDRDKLKENKGFVNNPAFIVSDKSVIVVDPGTSVQIGRAVLKHIRNMTDKPVTHVFNTHAHGDHWLGNHAFSEENPYVKIYSHPVMIKEAEDGAAQQWLDMFVSATNNAIKGTKIVLPTHSLKDQQLITIDDITIKSHLSEWAHTKTDAMLEVVEDKLLFTGDTVNNQRIVPFNEGSFKGSIDAITQAIGLDVNVVVPGHGATGDSHILANYKAGLAAIYQSAKALMEEGLEPFEMKEKVLSSHTEFKGWMGFEEEIGRYLSIAVLEAEQEDF